MIFHLTPAILVILAVIKTTIGCKCYQKYDGVVEHVIKSKLPHEYLKDTDLPKSWDWRNINGTNYCGKVLTQVNPNVCGSCWAEAATGALSDRYAIATSGKLRVTLAPQILINFNARTSGGSCNGGDDIKSYDFIHKYGIADDTCAPFTGLNWQWGFEVAAMTKVEMVQAHQCRSCLWDGSCIYVPREKVKLYGVEEFGSVKGVHAMKAEIYARGPISCLINSMAREFNYYSGGIVTCDGKDPACNDDVDHYVILAGWGVDKETGMEYWIGRNSYGTHWGEGAEGGWFRVKLGSDVLKLESAGCGWAVPAQADVDQALKRFDDAL